MRDSFSSGRRRDVPLQQLATHAALLAAIGDSLASAKRFGEAQKTYESAIEILQGVTNNHPDLLSAQETLDDYLSRLKQFTN